MIDLHGHMLPGIDDGARTLEQATSMARIAVENGISVSVMTPHDLNGVYSNPADEVRRLTRQFQDHLNSQGIELEVLPGAECHLVPELPRALADGRAMTIADRGKAVMVELPVHAIPMGATTILEEVMMLGLTPVIVHPERNSTLRQQTGRLAEWVDMGCLAQVTAQSCTGHFGAAVQEAACQMVTTGLIHFIASDAHRDRRRIPQIGPGRDTVGSWTNMEVAKMLSEDFPRAMIAGRQPDIGCLDAVLQKRPRRRSIWNLFRQA